MARKTLSFPKEISDYLDSKGRGQMSAYVVDLIKRDMNGNDKLTSEEIKILRDFIKSGKVNSKEKVEKFVDINEKSATKNEDSTVQAIAEGFIKRKAKRI